MKRLAVVASLVVGIFLASPISAVPLSNTWRSDLRPTIKVYLCIDTFNTQFPSMDKTALRATIEHSIWFWNMYSGVDFSLRSYGDRTGTSSGCGVGQTPPTGEITFRAEYSHPAGFLGATAASGNPITASAISIYSHQPGGSLNVFDFDQAGPNYTLLALINHEFGHSLGADHESSVPSVMNPTASAVQLVLWNADVPTFRNPSNTYHYNQVTNRQIKHKRSGDNAQTWASEGNLLEYTNYRIGVANNPSGGALRQYLVAWTGTDGNTTVNTIMGDGATYSSPTKIVHSGLTSNFGPAVAYGGGRYLMVTVSKADSRNLLFRSSPTGDAGWTAGSTVQYGWNATGGSFDYGSKAEAAVAWNANKSHFVLVWSNWKNQVDDNTLGKIRICTNPDPGSQNFYRCVEFPQIVHTSPGISCHPTSNECLVTWSEATGLNSHQICQQKGLLLADNSFSFTGSSSCISGQTSKAATGLANGGGFYVMGYRGDDGSRTGNSWRQSSYPTWTTPTNPTTLELVAPAVAFGSQFSEFAYYYVNYAP